MLGIKATIKLKQKKYREQYGMFLVEGKRAVADALVSDFKIDSLYISARLRFDQDVQLQSAVQKFAQCGKVQTIDEKTVSQLSSTQTPQGIFAVCALPELNHQILFEKKTIVVLEDIRDPGNLGTMIRTADWFGVDAIIAVQGADPYQPKVVRASMGSVFHLPIITTSDLSIVTKLKAEGFSVLVTQPESQQTTISQKLKSGRVVVAFGNEAAGTSPELDALADETFSIQKLGKAESLNVAISFGIVLFELRGE